MKKLGLNMAFTLLISVLFAGRVAADEIWWEHSDETYRFDLSRHRILVLLGEEFDYQETMVAKQIWEGWGAKVDLAGTAREVTGHVWKRTPKGWDNSERRTLAMDLLLSEVDIARYSAVFMPGGDSPKSLLKADSARVTGLIRRAFEDGKALAAICHGPDLLAAAGVVQGRRVTGHPEVKANLERAGGTYVSSVCEIDGNIITANWPYFESFAVAVAEKLLYPQGGPPSERTAFDRDPVLKAISERRSIRAFQDRDVEPAVVHTILQAATWAPSANNEQPWKFIVVRNKTIKQQVCDSVMARMAAYYESLGIPAERMKAYWESVFAAPVHVFAFSDPSAVEWDSGWVDIQATWNLEGVSAACQNMLLAAHTQGLGSLWFGLSLAAEQQIKQVLQVPEAVKLVTTIALGYPAQEPLPPVRKPVSEVTYSETWGRQ